MSLRPVVEAYSSQYKPSILLQDWGHSGLVPDVDDDQCTQWWRCISLLFVDLRHSYWYSHSRAAYSCRCSRVSTVSSQVDSLSSVVSQLLCSLATLEYYQLGNFQHMHQFTRARSKGKGQTQSCYRTLKLNKATAEALRYMARTKQRNTYLP